MRRSSMLSCLLFCLLCSVATAQQALTYFEQDVTNEGLITFSRVGESYTPVSVIRASQIPEPVKRSYQSVGRVMASTYDGQSFGSATYLGGGLWLTNNHVVQGGRAFHIALKNGQTYPAKLLQTVQSGEPDLALLQSQSLDQQLKAVPLAVNASRPGDMVFPSGFDKGRLEWHTIWPARVLRWFANGDYESRGLSRRGGAISGNSGGPTFNVAGELLSPLHSTTGDPSLGDGDTVAVCFQSTRRFLLPWREAIVRSLERQWARNRSNPLPQPIIINVAPSEVQRQPTPQPQMVPILRSDRAFRLELVPSHTNAETQQQCLPSPGYGSQPYPPGGYSGGGGAYGFGQQPARPVLPQEELPSFQPTQPTAPQEIQIDYDQLSDALIPKMREDGGFRGEPGPAGAPGAQGQPGPPGKDGRDGKDGTAANPQQLVGIQNGLGQLEGRLTRLEALVEANAKQIEQLNNAPPPSDSDPVTATPPAAMFLYYTSRGCEGCKDVDKRIEQLKSKGAPIVVTRLSPKDAGVTGVPRIFIPDSNRHIVGKSNCMVYLAGVSW